MANFLFTEGLKNLAPSVWTGSSIRLLLVKAGNNAAAVRDSANFLADITKDEFAGANYARQVLAGKTVTENAALHRTEYDADDVAIASLGADTTPATGAIVYIHNTNDADSIPLAFIDTGGFPKNGTGSTFTVQFNASGVITLTAA